MYILTFLMLFEKNTFNPIVLRSKKKKYKLNCEHLVSNMKYLICFISSASNKQLCSNWLVAVQQNILHSNYKNEMNIASAVRITCVFIHHTSQPISSQHLVCGLLLVSCWFFSLRLTSKQFPLSSSANTHKALCVCVCVFALALFSISNPAAVCFLCYWTVS